MSKPLASTRDWNFQVFFNFKDVEGRSYAEVKREEALVYLSKTFERSSRFSVLAKSEKEGSFLLLSGFVGLKNPCTLFHMKKILGKYSYCKPSVLNDVIQLLRYFNIDKDITVTGTLYRNLDAKFIMKVIQTDNARQFKDNGLPPAADPHLDSDVSGAPVELVDDVTLRTPKDETI